MEGVQGGVMVRVSSLECGNPVMVGLGLGLGFRVRVRVRLGFGLYGKVCVWAVR